MYCGFSEPEAGTANGSDAAVMCGTAILDHDNENLGNASGPRRAPRIAPAVTSVGVHDRQWHSRHDRHR